MDIRTSGVDRVEPIPTLRDGPVPRHLLDYTLRDLVPLANEVRAWLVDASDRASTYDEAMHGGALRRTLQRLLDDPSALRGVAKYVHDLWAMKYLLRVPVTRAPVMDDWQPSVWRFLKPLADFDESELSFELNMVANNLRILRDALGAGAGPGATFDDRELGYVLLAWPIAAVCDRGAPLAYRAWQELRSAAGYEEPYSCVPFDELGGERVQDVVDGLASDLIGVGLWLLRSEGTDDRAGSAAAVALHGRRP